MLESKRLELQADLENLLGSEDIYFQPPPNVAMNYPAIVYKLSDLYDAKADNVNYRFMHRYEAVLIHEDPDNDIYLKMIQLPYTRFVRFYVSNNLNHYVFKIYK